jgi:hypothetical protein
MFYLFEDIEDIKKWGIEVENKHNYLKIILIFGNYCPIIIKHYMHLLKKLAIKD